MKKHVPLFVASLVLAAVWSQVGADDLEEAKGQLVQAPDIVWGALNPARGEKGPRAGGLWNDRTQKQASGFLVKFRDGFSSPPHIHNVTYRGVVIEGWVHNDDPGAEKMWMPPGSFWTQPAGEVHITAAKGEAVTAYIEIDSGPYLVLPAEEAFDKGERPVNVVPSNLVWLSSSETSWVETKTDEKDLPSAEIAFLWGQPTEGELSGSFFRLPPRFQGELIAESGAMRVVVVKGSMVRRAARNDVEMLLEQGDYLHVRSSASHRVECRGDEGCLAYVRAEGTYKVRIGADPEAAPAKDR